ncbi:MAG: hypothetical protein K9N06_10745 [Candidatus Cloacimonetes bacterium]|nr:hypothetical protein [Candidatus Cloacimonadota bacterium]
MNRASLDTSARVLKQPSREAAAEYSTKKDTMAETVIGKLMAREDLDKLIGKENSSMMKDNAHNMARFMESIFVKFDPDILVETVLWVFRAYRSHGFQLTFWSAHLSIWIEVIIQDISAASSFELLPFYNWMQVNIPIFTSLTDGNQDE